MSDPVEKKKRATYQDVLDAPEHKVAEIIDGELFLFPRPSGYHASTQQALSDELGPPFRRGRGGPGGWIILPEPELHLGPDVVIPDLGGWRRERMPAVEDAPFFTLAPDWLCEVLSKATEKVDRTRKLRIYAGAGIQNLWLVNPRLRMLEVLRLHEGKWLTVAVHHDDERVRAEPFDAIELDLALLWQDHAPPARAGEDPAEYVAAP